MGGMNNELYGVVCGGQGRSGADMLWSACCVCGVVPLWFFRTFLSHPEEPPSGAGGGSVSSETTGERAPSHTSILTLETGWGRA